MQTMQRSATIVGAGIGGLTTAVALQQKGWRTTILEASPQVRAAGAGLTLSANAMSALRYLGLADKVLEGGLAVRSLLIRDHEGRTLSEVDPSFLSEPMVAIHRPVLHNILLEACADVEILVDQPVEDLASLPGDLVVGADGIHSNIRKILLPGSQPVYAGYTCWRGVVHIPGFTEATASETWGPEGRVGMVPIGGERVYWFASVNAEERAEWPKQMTTDKLADRFSRYPSPLSEIIRATANEDVLLNDIIDLDPIDRYAFGSIVLIGDAAHATTPNLGQGACQAIEDAVVLADRLARNDSVPAALLEYESHRLKRASGIVTASRRLGQVAQSTNPFVVGMRNLAMRATPISAQKKQMADVCTFVL